MYKKPKEVKTTTCLHDEVYANNQIIQTLKELIKENNKDIELYKIAIEDLKYL